MQELGPSYAVLGEQITLSCMLQHFPNDQVAKVKFTWTRSVEKGEEEMDKFPTTLAQLFRKCML